jgi:hypothetical protein
MPFQAKPTEEAISQLLNGDKELHPQRMDRRALRRRRRRARVAMESLVGIECSYLLRTGVNVKSFLRG